MANMPAEDGNDPGADTAMFRAYVDQSRERAAPGQGRTLIVGLVVVIAVLAVLALILAVA